MVYLLVRGLRVQPSDTPTGIVFVCKVGEPSRQARLPRTHLPSRISPATPSMFGSSRGMAPWAQGRVLHFRFASGPFRDRLPSDTR